MTATAEVDLCCKRIVKIDTGEQTAFSRFDTLLGANNGVVFIKHFHVKCRSINESVEEKLAPFARYRVDLFEIDIDYMWSIDDSLLRLCRRFDINRLKIGESCKNYEVKALLALQVNKLEINARLVSDMLIFEPSRLTALKINQRVTDDVQKTIYDHTPCLVDLDIQFDDINVLACAISLLNRLERLHFTVRRIDEFFYLTYLSLVHELARIVDLGVRFNTEKYNRGPELVFAGAARKTTLRSFTLWVKYGCRDEECSDTVYPDPKSFELATGLENVSIKVETCKRLDEEYYHIVDHLSRMPRLASLTWTFDRNERRICKSPLSFRGTFPAIQTLRIAMDRISSFFDKVIATALGGSTLKVLRAQNFIALTTTMVVNSPLEELEISTQREVLITTLLESIATPSRMRRIAINLPHAICVSNALKIVDLLGRFEYLSELVFRGSAKRARECLGDYLHMRLQQLKFLEKLDVSICLAAQPLLHYLELPAFLPYLTAYRIYSQTGFTPEQNTRIPQVAAKHEFLSSICVTHMKQLYPTHANPATLRNEWNTYHKYRSLVDRLLEAATAPRRILTIDRRHYFEDSGHRK